MKAAKIPQRMAMAYLAEDYDGIGQYVKVAMARSSTSTAMMARVAAGDFGGGRRFPAGTRVPVISVRGQLEVLLGNFPGCCVDKFTRFSPQGLDRSCLGTWNGDFGSHITNPDAFYTEAGWAVLDHRVLEVNNPWQFVDFEDLLSLPITLSYRYKVEELPFSGFRYAESFLWVSNAFGPAINDIQGGKLKFEVGPNQTRIIIYPTAPIGSQVGYQELTIDPYNGEELNVIQEVDAYGMRAKVWIKGTTKPSDWNVYQNTNGVGSWIPRYLVWEGFQTSSPSSPPPVRSLMDNLEFLQGLRCRGGIRN